MIEHSIVYVIEDIRPAEVVGFDMRRITKDTRARPHTDGLEPGLGDLYRLTLTSSFGILVFPIVLLEDR